MGRIFSAPKISAPEPSPETQEALRRSNQASAELERRNREETQRSAERARRDREAFARGLRGRRSLFSAAGELGFQLPSTLGGR